jgi:hypothetical protein
MTAMVIFGLSFCFPIKGLDKDHNSRNSLDWEGVYTGTTPWASERINVLLRRNLDQSFVLEYDYLDRPDDPVHYFPGLSFQWDDTGNTITIDILCAPTHYKVAENKLIRLDENGMPLYNYVLKKERRTAQR